MSNRETTLQLGAELGPISRIVYWIIQNLARIVAFVFWRAYAHDAHKMPSEGPVIVSPVHRSNLDVPLLGATSPRRLRYLAKDSLFRGRFWGWFMVTMGAFPLKRSAKLDREAVRASLTVLERGEPLAVFPEGERKSGPRVHPALDGAVWLSVKTGAPILPVGIGGSYESMPKGAKFPKPSRIVYLYGDPVMPPEPTEGAPRVSRDQIREASAELREIIQALYDEAQRRAGHEDKVEVRPAP